MRIRVLLVAAVCGALATSGAWAQGRLERLPRPDYTIEDVEKALVDPFAFNFPPAPAPRPRPRVFPPWGDNPPTGPSDQLRPKRKANEPSPVLTLPAASAPAPRGLNLRIEFENRSTTLTAQAKANARVFAQAMNSPPFAGSRFAIEGHTNEVGAADYNRSLSLARAFALAGFLVTEGVKPARLEVEGFGFDQPLNKQNPAAEENRRVEARRLP